MGELKHLLQVSAYANRMSCSCCCCVTSSGELLEGIRKKKQLVQEDEEEQSRRTMDMSLLRERYRNSRDTQRTHSQLLLFRTVSDNLLEDTNVFPISQVSASPLPAVTFDPWHIHLDLHRRSCAAITVPPPGSSSEITNTRHSSSRESLSSSEEMSSWRSLNGTKEEDLLSVDQSRGDSDSGSSGRSREGSVRVNPDWFSITTSLDVREQSPDNGSRKDPPDVGLQSLALGSLSSSDESSTPVASSTCSSSSSNTNIHEDPKEGRTTHIQNSHGVLKTSSTPVWGGSRKFSTHALRFTRQLSMGGVGSSSGAPQNQNYHPFPNRKTPKISEAARRLGMYSSF
ncbi:uncharacterized protein LOC115061324 [Echeneis naucrates]|uniref:uncharacterized protein LOC115061324 n=1 Tax=Echeneis naucrates TaxID=173247 RepID=UPI001114568D|nr:uncharacterized protein LOC115061324 [Echeneis naucrates]